MSAPLMNRVDAHTLAITLPAPRVIGRPRRAAGLRLRVDRAGSDGWQPLEVGEGSHDARVELDTEAVGCLTVSVEAPANGQAVRVRIGSSLPNATLFGSGVSAQRMGGAAHTIVSNRTDLRAILTGSDIVVLRGVNHRAIAVTVDGDDQTDDATEVCFVSNAGVAESHRWLAGGSDTVRTTPAASGERVRLAFTIEWGHEGNDPVRRVGPVSHPREALASHLAVWASTTGAIDTTDSAGSLAVTLATPLRTYAPATNFCDVDVWTSVCTLLYAGDADCYGHVRDIIDKSGADIQASGQIPHHYEPDGARFVAISDESQFGPNVFWILSSLAYASYSADDKWVAARYLRIRAATDFLVRHIDDVTGLAIAPGPLWIDVFRRWGMTSDSNVFLVHVFRKVAELCDARGDADAAAGYRASAEQVADGLMSHLWSGDHLVTQLSEEGIRDFDDIDSNALAVALGVLPDDAAVAAMGFLKRVIPVGSMPTLPSGIRYDADDCVEGNVGDSDVAMARIAWAEAHAWARIGRSDVADERVIAPLLDDVLAATWLTERYSRTGERVRATYYHEYPEVVTMLVHELLCGIVARPGGLAVDPIWEEFDYQTVHLGVTWSNDRVVIRDERLGRRTYDLRVGGSAGSTLQVLVDGVTTDVAVDLSGFVRVSVPAASSTITVLRH